MKKIICGLLALLISATVFTACSSDDNETSSTTPTEQSQAETSSETSESTSKEPAKDPYKNENGDYAPVNKIEGVEGKTFSVLVRGAKSAIYQSTDFLTEGDEFYGDLMDTAVKNRNQKIADQYGIELKVYKSDTMDTDIKHELDSGDGTYDLVMPTIPYLATLAASGSLYDLKQFDGEQIHLEAPWYDKNANETFSIGNRLFFSTGDLTILNKVCTSSILFNKEMISKLNMDNPYVLVNNHQWTYDKMKTMAKAATADTDGESGMSGKDNWGLLASYADALTFYGAAGQFLCTKDGDDYPIISLGDETTISVIQKILTDMTEKDTWVVYAQQFEAPIWVTSLDAFIQGRILFRPSAFSATTKLRIAGADFGIVPLPLWTEEQDDYCSYCGVGETVGFGILNTVKDPEFSATMLELYSCEAKNYITPAYMDVNLKSKDVQDDESLEMLNIIFDNIVYDIGDVYRFGTINSLFSTLVQGGSTDIVSRFDSIKDSVQDAIDEIVEAYEIIG